MPLTTVDGLLGGKVGCQERANLSLSLSQDQGKKRLCEIGTLTVLEDRTRRLSKGEESTKSMERRREYV